MRNSHKFLWERIVAFCLAHLQSTYRKRGKDISRNEVANLKKAFDGISFFKLMVLQKFWLQSTEDETQTGVCNRWQLTSKGYGMCWSGHKTYLKKSSIGEHITTYLLLYRWWGEKWMTDCWWRPRQISLLENINHVIFILY